MGGLKLNNSISLWLVFWMDSGIKTMLDNMLLLRR